MRISDWSSDVCSSDLEFFADPQLETFVATALERNRDLAVAVAQIQEARGLYRIQDAERLPALGASGDVTRSRTPGSTIGIPEAGAITDTRYAIGVGVTGFELDFWGRVRRSEEQTSELQSLMRISYAVFCLKKKRKTTKQNLYLIV